MWQKCPICNGTGYSPIGTFTSMPTCPTCNGHRIISEISGLPPIYEVADKLSKKYYNETYKKMKYGVDLSAAEMYTE